MTIRPIQTPYKGYLFRSRLEARWAVYFDSLKIDWEYEPEGFQLPNGEWYLPDFWIPTIPHGGYTVAGLWVEIKPRPLNKKEIENLEALTKSSGHHGFALIGTPGKHAVHKFMHHGYNFITKHFSPEDGLVDYPLPHEIYLNYDFSVEDMYINGVKAARSARFEHGAQT